jgi:hypothetical protein
LDRTPVGAQEREMHFTEAQLREYRTRGFLVLRDAFTELGLLTADFVRAYRSLAADPPPEPDPTAPSNKFRTRPVVPGAYWSELDHSLPALRIILHREVALPAVISLRLSLPRFIHDGIPIIGQSIELDCGRHMTLSRMTALPSSR